MFTDLPYRFVNTFAYCRANEKSSYVNEMTVTVGRRRS